MIDHFYHLTFDDDGRSLQEQLRESLLAAILRGNFPTSEPLPSSRKLAQQLAISRSTVALVYESLLASRYIVSRPRSGYFVHPEYADVSHDSSEVPKGQFRGNLVNCPNWDARIQSRPTGKRGTLRPENWADYKFPFVHGQPIRNMFPLQQWREVSRNMLRNGRNQSWMWDYIDRDDPMLIEQLRTRVLPKRGIWANADEILVTMGFQNALHLLSSLLMNQRAVVAMENPGYRDAINNFELHGAEIVLQPVDEEGITLNGLDRCDYLYVTPGHQAPTGVALSSRRRIELSKIASTHDLVIIEDDFDAEFHLDDDVMPALKADDQCGRIVYVSSMSKALAPGMRIGYMVGHADLIDELRALRRLMYRHPPHYNQRLLAEFVAQGYYDAYLRRFRSEHYRRSEMMQEAIGKFLPGCQHKGKIGANAFWIAAPERYDTNELAWAAHEKGILFEPGSQFYYNVNPPRNFMRLGFHALDAEKIFPGIELLGRVLGSM